MDNDAREIYEAVLGEVKKDLSKIAPRYEEKILLSVEQKVMERLSELARWNEQLEKQLNFLRGQIEDLKDNRVNGYQEGIANAYLNTDDTNRIDMSRFDIRNGVKFNGWIYYANEEMCDFLYKVRVDGTDNQQLTDYSVDLICAHVKNGKLYFDDSDDREHSIDL